jgi:chemotaxis protein MotB
MAVVALAQVAQGGCIVWKRDYEKVVASAADAKAAADARDRDQSARLVDLQQRLTAAEAGMQERDGKISELATGLHNVQAQLDEATAINQELRAALERLGKDADKLLADRGTLSKALDDARARLEELRRAQAAAEWRVALFRDFEQRFATLIQAGQLRIDSRRGGLVMDVSGDLLFDPGHAELRSAGKGALMEIAQALQTVGPPTRRFLVTDHLDDEPFKSRHWRSVWELTCARGATVVEYLVSLGVPAESLRAAGAGSSDPIAPNDTPDARTRNRRLEIALLLSADGLGAVPATPSAPAAVRPTPPPVTSSAPPPPHG